MSTELEAKQEDLTVDSELARSWFEQDGSFHIVLRPKAMAKMSSFSQTRLRSTLNDLLDEINSEDEVC